jgi:hypothetical protein
MILSTYYDKSIIDVASGFLLTNNVLVTTWTYLENALVKGQYISVRDKDGNVYIFEGVVTFDVNSDIALIKIEDTAKEGVILGDASILEKEDVVITFSTKSGLGIGAQAGIVINNSNSKLQNLLPLTQTDMGSPLFNATGKVVGINTGDVINASTSYANYAYILKDVQEKLIDSTEIKNVSFDELKEQFYYSKKAKEETKNNVEESVWEKYSKIGDIEQTITLPLISANYKNNILSLRYDNSVDSLLNSDFGSKFFIAKLKTEGYQEKLNTNIKKIYENNKNRIIIMKEFNYLIIVMVKL